MIKYIIILFFLSCQKPSPTIAIQSSVSNIDGKIVSVNQDTIVNDVWDGGGKVLRINDYKIRGNGTLSNWIIDAAYTQWIFDTSVNLVNIKTYTGVFSVAWYGASSSNADNWWNIQKSIHTSIANGIKNCFVPQGKYNYSKPLEIYYIYKNAYAGCTLRFYGESSFWDSGNGTTLNLTKWYDCGLNLQLNKGSEVDHLTITGQWKSPITKDSIYFNTSYANYKDISGNNCNEWYYGIAIDWRKPIDGKDINGSTGLKIHDINISGFTHLIAVSQNNITKNAEILLFENIHLGEGKTGFINGQSQEKGNMIRGVYAWGRLHTLLSFGSHGLWQNGDYHIDGGNIAGRVIRCFDINASGWFSTFVENIYFESIATIGNISTNKLPISIANCSFNFKYISEIGRVVLLTSNSLNVLFTNCSFRYYNWLGEDMDFNGVATFNNCYFSGKIV